MNEVPVQGNRAASDELSTLLDEAERRIASSELGKACGFHTLPAIFVLGLPGSGRTTAMTQSGLDPELLAGRVVHDGAILPTELINIWYAGGTVFIEPGQRLQSDQELWMRLLQRFRSNTGAPRSALVCHGCDNLTASNAPAAAVEAARWLRNRLTEIAKTLSVQLPVYVLFCKLDRVLFFHEFTRNLVDQETSMVLGATLAVTVEHPVGHDEREGARLNQGFEDLVFSLAGKRPELLAREKDGAALSAVYEFPREFRKIRIPLAQFLVELCRPGQLRPNPFLRGFYFCGVRPIVVRTQVSAVAPRPDAEPADPNKTRQIRVERQMEGGQTRAFRFDPQMAAGQTPRAPAPTPSFTMRTVPQWVLLKDLFSSILLLDSAHLQSDGEGKKNKSGAILMAAAAVVFLLIAGLFTYSYMQNQALLHGLRDSSKAIPLKADAASPAMIDALEHLDSLRLALVRLSDYQRHGPPWTMGLGLYAGSQAYPELRRLYFDRFQSLLFNETRDSLASELKALRDAPGPSDDYSRAYETLRAWLEITSHHETAVLNFLPAVLEDRWVHGRGISPRARKLARTQLEFYTSELAAAKPFPTDDQPDLVARARKYLSQFGDSMRIYKSMVNDVNRTVPALVFNQSLPGSAAVVVNTFQVPGAFTNAGFEAMKSAMNNSAKYGGGGDWVLGDQKAAPADNSASSKIQGFYNAEYIACWRDYLAKSSVVKFANLNEAATKLDALSGPQSPLVELFKLAAQNTAVDAEEIKKGFAPLQSLVPAVSDAYRTALANLQTAVASSSKLPPDQSDAAAAKIKDAGAAARVVVQKTAESLGHDPDAHLETVIAKLLEDPISNVEMLAPMGAGGERLNGAGAVLCRQFRGLFSKAPFQPNAKAVATPDEMNAIFRPRDGALFIFYTVTLKDLVTRQGNRYTAAPNAKSPVSPSFLGFFNRAMQFSDALYASGGPDPLLAFALKPALSPDIQSVTLTIDGQTATFAPDSPAQKFSWPGTGVRMIAKSSGENYAISSYDGPWSVFDFFYDADKPPPSPEWLYRVGRQGKPFLSPTTNLPVAVHFDLDMLGNPPVFQKGYLQDLACVAEVAGK